MTTTKSLIQDWQEQLAQATANHTPLQLCGSGSKNFYGPQVQGQVLDLRGNQGVVDYEPSELVMVVKGGTRLSEVEALLAERNQCLAFEPPHFGPDATIAGCIAAGLSGPRRANAGGLKDFVLGVKIIDGLGQHLSFGGQVMKNVAGYDVSRVIAGSFGSLGVIDELSIKVLPIPERTLTLRLNLPQDKALDLFNTLGGQPVAISATAWFNDQAYIRLSGAPEALLAGKNRIGGDELSEADAAQLWTQLREQQHAWFQRNDAGHLWRLSVPSTTPVIDSSADVLVEWGGALRWQFSTASEDEVRAQVSKVGGTANVFRAQGAVTSAFHPLPEPMLSLQQRLKKAFDPAGVLNPGRLYTGVL